MRNQRLFGICTGFLLLAVMTVAARRGEPPRYRTAYACEGRQLEISCGDGGLIHLIRANYGRFSISICNEHGTLDWSVDCMSHRSFRVMQDRCGRGMSSCSFNVTSDLFGGDPCPGTNKYLEVHYLCHLETTTTTTSQKPQPPPIIIPATVPQSSTTALPTAPPISNADVSSSSVTTTATSTTTTAIFASSPTSLPASSSSKQPHIYKIITSYLNVTKGAESEVSTSTRPTTSEPTTEARVEMCPPVYARGLFWNWTKSGEMAIQSCPGGAKGHAKWLCSLSPTKWTPSRPDMGMCSSIWVSNLDARIYRGDPVVSLAAEMALMTKEKPLYGADMINCTSILNQLISRMEDGLEEFPDEKQGHQVAKELIQSVVDISNNLLEDYQRDSWQDLPRTEQRRAATSLIRALERSSLLLAETQNRESHFVRAKNNVLVSVHVIDARSVSSIRFPNLDDTIYNPPWSRMEDSIILPSQSLLEHAHHGLVKPIFLAYNKLDVILNPDPPNELMMMMMPPMDPEWEYNVTRVINSRIVSVLLGRRHPIRLPEPVIITLRHLQEENVTNPRCVYWNIDREQWSGQGCWVLETNITHTRCSCDHLTSFAILMDVRATELPFGHEVALRFITYVGCVISIVCLLLTILTFQLFRGLKSDRTTIHKNLCICLLVAEAVFVSGINQTHMPILCGIIAGLLHYYFLAAFAWMFLEGFQLYVMLIEVFESEKTRIRWYYILAYGIPGIIVGVSAITDPHSYGTIRYCWLRADNYFIFSFVGPVIAILLANMVFLSIAIYMMCHHANLTTAVKSKEQTKLTTIKIWVRGAMVLVFLLGLTWAFGLLYLNEESVIMAYFFTILNSLQGLFIFMFHCVRNEKVQKEYQKLLHRAHWMPECLREPKSSQPKWGSQKERKSSTSSSSVLKSSTPGHQSTTNQTLRSSHERQSNRSHRTSDKNNSVYGDKDSKYSVDDGGICGDLSMADCSVVDSQCLPDYGWNNAPTLTRDHCHQSRQQHILPPYGHLTGNSTNNGNPFVDHIYECIDEDPFSGTKRHLIAGVAAQQQQQQLEGHIRTHSDSSRLSTTSYNCDHHPLIPASHPQHQALTALAQAINTTPRHSTLPTGRDQIRCPNSAVLLARSHYDASSAGSLPEIKGPVTVLPAHMVPSQVHVSDSVLQSMPNIHASDGARGPPSEVVRYPSDSAVVMAVLDGEKVVCRLQPEAPTNTCRSPHCSNFSHLSTDC